MNEGHAAFLTLELLHKHKMDFEKVKEMCAFTTHSIVYHDGFSYDIVSELMGQYFPLETLKRFGGRNALNMTVLGLNLSKYANGVSKGHRDVSTKLFPDFKIRGITNGVHSFTWTSESFRKIYDDYFPGWLKEPELLSKIDLIPNEKIWQAHTLAKKILIDYVNEETDVNMDYETLTIGFARRVTGYKRANLIFSDCDRLKKVNQKGNIQIIFAGNPHHKDEQGRLIIKFLSNCINQLKNEIDIVYLEDYDIEIAAKLIPGVDIWLNTPLPPFEASGTSGMKAAHNGVINFSTLDGWWTEGWIEGITGWSIGPQPNEVLTNEEQRSEEIEDMYNKLEYIIVPTFYQKRDKWIRIMKNSIGILAPYFNSHRMFFQYVKEAYY
jgi:starch phosphorylase